MSPPTRLLVESEESESILSVASVWEIAIKVSLGRFRLPLPIADYFEDKVNAGLQILPIEWRHAAKVADLPLHHKDPFDRLIAAQALVENLPLVSRDPIFKKYGVKLIW